MSYFHISHWLQDTIARRFAATAVFAVAITVALIYLFGQVAGSWSQAPLEQTGLLNEAVDMFRMVEAAPAATRPALCSAATSNDIRLKWYPARSVAALGLAPLKGAEDGETARLMSQKMQRPAVVFGPQKATRIPMQIMRDGGYTTVPYGLAIELADESWLLFIDVNRSWGVSQPARWSIRALFLVLSVLFVTAIAARQFSRPIEHLADAVREFGKNPQGAPIPETGPRELRLFIRTFNDMRSQIQTFVSHRTAMLAAISHDLRTPLTRIRLRGELIEDRDQQARLFRDVDDMQAMVDGALAFFRDDAVSEEDTSLDLPHLIKTITNDYADQGIVIPYAGVPRGTIKGRPLALKRALTNVIDNAVKYGRTAEIQLQRSHREWSLIISDQGPGIPAEALAIVFRPYYRLEKSRNRATGGVGLGLTVTQAIIQAHGGTVTLANRPEGGLAVHILLPNDLEPVVRVDMDEVA